MKAETKGYLLDALIAVVVVYLIFKIPFLKSLIVGA